MLGDSMTGHNAVGLGFGGNTEKNTSSNPKDGGQERFLRVCASRQGSLGRGEVI